MIMWTPRDFSYTKLARKYKQDGAKEAFRSSSEFATRKLLAPPILHRLIDREIVQTVCRSELFSLSNRLYVSQDESSKSQISKITDSEFVADIGRGYVLPSTGLCVDDSGRLVQESVGPPRTGNNFVIETLVWHGFYDSLRLSNALLFGDTSTLNSYAKEVDVLCPLCPRFTNYYHWLIETIPKLRYAKEYSTMLDVSVTYLVPADAPAWLDQTLQLLDVPRSSIEHATAPVYQADRLLIPSFPGLKLQNYRWIREAVLTNMSSEKEVIGTGNNVYISRANAIERQVVNEADVVETLSEYGFESYQLEENTVEENVLLFNEADMIVGPHGAGLTDIVFCDESKVIELFGSKVKNPYEQLAETLGIEYQSLRCTPRSTDIMVDTKQLENLVM